MKLLVIGLLFVGSVFSFECSFRWDGCTGPRNTDCIACVEKAEMDHRHRWVCKNLWAGADCSTYIGNCHPRCDGCNGPTDFDCDFCVNHAIHNEHGQCVCDYGWGDEACTRKIMNSLTTVCDKKCIGCRPGYPNMCNKCVKNAFFTENSECDCIDEWTGDDCSINVHADFICDKRCRGCNGPSNYDCMECVDHASVSAHGACLCDPYFSGNSCEKYTPPTRICDPKCKNGCDGPSDYDCYSCVDHAVLTQFGRCVCESFYVSDDCSVFSGGECSPKCGAGGCTGPKASDCLDCTKHARFWGYGECQCETFWEGDRCDQYTGACSAKCKYGTGCHGPEDSACVTCVENAHTDQSGTCVCDHFYTGDRCNIYKGPCHKLCYGCTGQTAFDCKFCVPHATENMLGACECESDWTGDDCSIFIGKCDAKCVPGNCNGPTNGDCDKCVKNASWDRYGYCIWEDLWGGFDCNEFQGTCDVKCMQCIGPGPDQCLGCIENAYVNIEGECQCVRGWSREDCSQYELDCHPLCNGCIGPDDTQCLKCAENAQFDEDRRCVCSQFWSGLDCQTYLGLCNPRCTSCYGPNANQCTECIRNATMDEFGYCTCKQYWSGLGCSYWDGVCDSKCETCYGPNACDCEKCVNHAHWDTQGCCVCEEFRTGNKCQTFSGPCDPKCMQSYGCTGLDAGHCNMCNQYTNWTSDSFCKCDEDRTGSDCSTYIGECHALCSGCTGPSVQDCRKCKVNARWDDEHSCHCDNYWTGASCDVFIGTCNPKCNTDDLCYGPLDSQCATCTQHAYLNPINNRCECRKNWSGVDCSIYIGFCHEKCSVCNGPNFEDCFLCIDKAVFISGVGCICEKDWSGDFCTQWTGLCHPKCLHGCTNSGATDCVSCVHNAYYDDYEGCKCLPNWDGYMCEEYAGECDSMCRQGGCQGSGPGGCYACIEHAYKSEQRGICVCDTDWAGDLCRTYVGNCPPSCQTCSGPTTCEQCGQHAEEDESGLCQCHSGWTGVACDSFNGLCIDNCSVCLDDTSCLLCAHNATLSSLGCVCSPGWDGENWETWSGQCHKSCNTCDGPSSINCTSCATYATLKTGSCSCHAEWGPFCTSFIGTCHDKCLSCSGPKEVDCIECVSGASKTEKDICACESNYSGPGCSIYIGKCHGYCSQGCTGPSSADCISCALNAKHVADSGCVCKPGYMGESCQEYDQSKCHSRCLSCNGPSSSDCILCSYHAYHSSNRHCVCEDDWAGEDCSDYQGSCDSMCLGCVGPSFYDWDSCVYHAEKTISGECQCVSGWTGPRCEFWRGECNSKCIGCTGPAESDCETCIRHAYHELIDGQSVCSCNPGRFGEFCENQVRPCHINCGGNDNCNPYLDANVCTNCATGFSLQNGTCISCDKRCKSWELSNPMACLSCYDGFYARAGQCHTCSAKCEQCNGAPDVCTSCFEDSQLVGTTCRCESGLTRNPTTLKCETRCPTGFSKSFDNFCEEISSNHRAVTFDFGKDGPWLSNGSDKTVIGDWCNLPYSSLSRGMYFDGSSSISLRKFYIHSSYTFGFWAKALQPDVSLLSYQYTLWEGWDEWERESNDAYFKKLFESPRVDSLHISKCDLYKLKTDLENKNNKEIEGMEFNQLGWNYFGFSEKSDFDSSSKKLFVNKNVSSEATSDAVIIGPMDAQIDIGSYEGLTKFFVGFIHEFAYYTSPDAEIQFGICGSKCDYCPVSGCISDCSINEFISNQACIPCDDLCEKGCSSRTKCAHTTNDCHLSCKNCTGPSPNQCTDCRCGAQLTSMNQCKCKPGFTGHPSNCQAQCHESCDVCHSPAPDDCVVCKDSYHMVSNTLVASAQVYCEWCFEDLYDRFPTCGAKEWNDEAEECMCDEGTWFDSKSKSCRHCSHNCVECSNKDTQHTGMHCHGCTEGYVFMRFSDICVENCPTGFMKSAYFDSCIGTGQYVIDFHSYVNEASLTRNWKFEGEYKDMGQSETITWNTQMYGGRRESPQDPDDPILYSDRGLWFDGAATFMSVKGLLLNHSFTLSSWIKPHGAGSLFSSSRTKNLLGDLTRHLSWSSAIDGYLWEDSYHHSFTKFNAQNLYEWHHTSIMVIWDQYNHVSTISFTQNVVEAISKHSINFITLDFQANDHLIGGIAYEDGIQEMFKGFMFTFRIFNGVADNSFSSEVLINCDRCEMCPPDPGTCLGVCNWNYYWEESKCKKCPYWCTQGCTEDGTC